MLKLDFSLVWTVIDIFVLYLLMKRFLFGPLTAVMEKRKEIMENQMAEAKGAREEAFAMKAQYEQTLSHAQEEGEQIIEQRKAEAGKEYDKILHKAELDADKLLKDAKETMEAERAKTYQDMESEINGLALAAAMKILSHASDTQTNEAIYNQFLRQAGEGNDANME